MQRKIFKIKLKNRVVAVGSTGVALLAIFADAVKFLLSGLPDYYVFYEPIYGKRRNFNKFSRKEYVKKLNKLSGINLDNTISRLKHKGLIAPANDGYTATDFGKKVIKEIVGNYRLNAPRREEWDGKWRLITFDIPEKRRRERNWLRQLLKVYGYISLQKSVFAGKHPLSENIYRELGRKGLTSNVCILTVGEIDADLRELF